MLIKDRKNQREDQDLNGEAKFYDNDGNFDGDLGEYVAYTNAKERAEWEKYKCSPEHIDTLMEAGVQIFPVEENKKPRKGWQTYKFSREELIAHNGPLGIIPGTLGLSVIDVDAEKDAEKYPEPVKNRIEKIGMPAFIQKSKSGGVHVAIKTKEPIGNIKWEFEGTKGDLRGLESGLIVMWQSEKWANFAKNPDSVAACDVEFYKFVKECGVKKAKQNGKFDWDADSIRDAIEYLDPEVDRQTWISYCRAAADACCAAKLDEEESIQIIGEWSKQADNWGGDDDFLGVLRVSGNYEGPKPNGRLFLKYVKEGGWDVPVISQNGHSGQAATTPAAEQNEHGGARPNAGRPRLNDGVGCPLTVLSEACVRSGNFERVSASLGHWREDKKEWECSLDSGMLGVIAVRDYLDIAALEPAQSITKGIGTTLKSHLKINLKKGGFKTPKEGIWPEKSGKVFDQFTGKRREVDKTDYIISWLDYCIDESVTECPDLLWGVILSGLRDEETAKKMLDILAYICFSDNRFQRFFHFYGKDRSGKGTITRLIEWMLGTHACASLNLQELKNNEERALVHAPGKKLLTMEEGEGPFPYPTIKKIVGGDSLTARALWEEAITFNYTEHVLTVSQTPMRFYDRAFEARLEAIQFVQSPKKPDTNLGHKLKALRPQIMGFLWNHWKSHIKDLDEWTSSALMNEGKLSRAESDDGYKGWMNTCLKDDETKITPIKEIRKCIIADAEREGEEMTAKDKKYLTQNIKRYAETTGIRAVGKSLYAVIVNRGEIEAEEKEAEESQQVQRELDSAGELKSDSDFSGTDVEFFV